LDAVSGAFLISTVDHGYKKTFAMGDTLNRDALTLTTTGNAVFFLTFRDPTTSLALMRLEFDGSNSWVHPSTSYSWYADGNFNVPD